MAGEAELADMFLTLRAVNAPLLKGFSQVSAAGEEMVAAINASLAEVDAAIARTAGSLQALRDGMAEVGASAGRVGAEAGAGAASATAGAGAAGASATGVGSAAAAEAAAVDAATAEEQAAWDRQLASFKTTSAEIQTGLDRQAAKFAGMSAEMTASTDVLVAQANKYGTSLAGVGAATDKAAAATPGWQSGLGNVSGSLLKVGAAGALTAGAVVDMAAKFETSTTRLVTSGGEAAAMLQTDQQGILKLAGQVGYSANDLSAAMYKITSAGQSGTAALDTLKAAAQGAKTENANLTTVADAVSTAMIDYKGKVGSAADVTSQLVAATSQGKTNFQDLAGAMSAILPKASAAHINFSEILGDLASMTQHGTGAQQAAENLADAISHMQNPTAVMSKELAALGLNATDLAQNLGSKGLSGTLGEISAAVQKDMGPQATSVVLNLNAALKGLPPAVQTAAQSVMDGTQSLAGFTAATKALPVEQAKQAQSFATLYNSFHQIGSTQMTGAQVMQTYAGAMAKATGDSASLNVALMLTGTNAPNTSKAIDTVSKAAADAHGNVEGWSQIQGTFNQQLSEAKDGLGAAAIAVGDKLLPPVTVIVGKLALFAQWLSGNKIAASAFAIVIGTLLAGGLIGVIGKLAQFSIAMAGNLIKPITGSIGLIRNFAGGLKGAESAVGTFGGRLGSATSTIGGWMSSLGQAIAVGAKWAWSMIAQGASVAAGAGRSAAVTSSAWIGSIAKQAATTGGQAAAWAAGQVRQYGAVAAGAVKQAAVTTGAWVAAGVKMIGQGIAQIGTWVAGMVAKFTAVAVSAVVEAAITVGAWVAANIAMIAATGGIILLLGLVVTAAIFLATHWTQVWNAIKTVALAVWHWIEDNVVTPLVKVWNDYIVPAIHMFGAAWDSVWNGVKSTISFVWNNILKPIFDAIGTAIKNVVGAIGNVVNTAKSIGSGIGHLLGFDQGGWVPGSAGQPRLAVVHGGEYVLSQDMLSGRVAPDVPLSNERGSGSAVAPMFGGGGAAVTVVHMPISVGGSVVTDANLTSALQKAFLQLSSRNVGFGTNVAFS